MLVAFTDNKHRGHTAEADVVRFHKEVLDLAALDNQRIPLASVVSED